MKTTKNLFYLFIVSVFTFTACSPEEPQKPEVLTTTITFEDVELGETGYWNGDLSGTLKEEESSWGEILSNYYGGFSSNGIYFENIYTPKYFSWSGFACSAKTDTETADYSNEGSVIVGSGAEESVNYAVIYNNASLSCEADEYGYFTAKSAMIANATWTYYEIKNGSYTSAKFTDGNWFKLIITGYLNDTETGTVEYYLADYQNGKTFVSDKWESVDLSKLGKVNKITFSLDSDVTSSFGITVPVYACIDNIEFEQTIPTE